MVSIEKRQKFDELACNEKVSAEISKIKSAEELQQVLRSYDLEMTLDEIREIADEIAEKLNIPKDGELTAEQMEAVTGGGKWLTTVAGVSGIVLGAATGDFWLVAYCTVALYATWRK